MKNIFKLKVFIILSFILLVFVSACFKHANYAFITEENSIDSTIAIRALRKMHTVGDMETIQKSLAIVGWVVANDEHDNLYKTISIQDSTGGILLLLDGTNLYQDFPVGALLKIRVQNLVLTDYRRMYQLGAGIDSSTGSMNVIGLPVPLFSKHITVLKDQINLDNQVLESRIAQISSLTNIASSAAQLGFITIKQIEYIK